MSAANGTLPTEPTIRRAPATADEAPAPGARVSMAETVTAGRSVKLKRRWDRAARSGRAGSSTAVSSSPGASAVSYRPVRKAAAGIRRVDLAVLADHRGAGRQQERGRVGVRVGEAQVPAQGADRTHPHVRHLRDHRAQLGIAGPQHERRLDLAVGGRGADADPAGRESSDAVQGADPLQVDQVLVAGQAELHGQQQLGAAAVGGPLVAQVGEQARGLPDRLRAVQGERREFQ